MIHDSSTPTIRPMQSADLQAAFAIAAASAEAPQWRPTDYEPYIGADPAAHGSLSRVAIVATQAGGVAGFVAATLRPDPEPPEGSSAPNLCELDSIAVHPAARRKGTASALVSALLAWAASQHATRLTLEVRASNAAALALYRRFGLRIRGRRPGYYTHPEEDALLLDIPVTAVCPMAPFSTEKVLEAGPPRC